MMENKKLPKVLVVSTNAWRDNTGINTLIEFFKCWDPERLAQIYTKSSLPHTIVCNTFFRISENAVMRSILYRKTITGTIVQNETDSQENADTQAVEEQKMYAKYTGKIRSLMSFCREIVWKIGRWKTVALNEFIDNYNADVLYIPIYPTIYMGRIQKYIMQRTGKPVISYLADDNYTFQSTRKDPVSLLQRCILRKYVRFIVKNSSKLMVIAPKQKEEYDKIFGVDSIVMTKGVDFDSFKEYKVNTPIKMVYTGKLIIGRWKSLAAIANELGDINKDHIRVELDIYTTDVLTGEQEMLLNRNGCKVKGALSLQEVKMVQEKADVLVFAESLEKEYKYTARLSFSTKITDYLRSGKCIFAIGDKEIAPIDYFNRYDSAITASTYEEIGIKLKYMLYNPDLIKEYAQKAYNCGVKNHERCKMDKLLIETIQKAGQESVNNG